MEQIHSVFNKYAQWYQEVRIDRFDVQTSPLHVTKPIEFMGLAKNGMSVILFKLGEFYPGNTTIIEGVQYIGASIEQYLQKSKPHLDKALMILDIQNVSMKNLRMDTIKQAIPIFSNYFPDTLYKEYVVNANFLVSGFLKVVKK